jgi:hypothetical protein
MLALSIFAVVLAIALLVTATWGMDQARALRISERRRANAFRIATLAGEREQHHRAISREALTRLRDAYAVSPPHHHTCSRDLHDSN